MDDASAHMPVKLRPKPSRILGIDYGLARIGIAISDEQKIISNTLMTFYSEKSSEATALKLVKEIEGLSEKNGYSIESIVIGMPFLMNGKRGMLADEVSHFITLLKGLIDIPITPWDERLSSVQADRSLREGNFTRKKRSKMVDVVAATILLQNFKSNTQT